MFEIGEYVLKIGNGVCRIDQIGHPDFAIGDKKQMYYYLVPETKKGTKLYVPVDGAEGRIRDVMTKDEAIELIEHMDEIAPLNVKVEKLREQEYKDAIRSGKPEQIVSVIKDLYFRRKKRLDAGKKTTACDEKYFRMAEDELYTELAFVLDKERDDIPEMISDIISKK
ncbi:MAG: hypothetical protein E7282_01075 [Lachnospiraceae bacterium]|nr:hypothetical protein [Lachnospiraceae bacterium]